MEPVDNQEVPADQVGVGGDTIPETDAQAIERLAQLDPMDYDRVRKDAAHKMGVQTRTLDDAVKAARKSNGQDVTNSDSDGGNLLFPEIEPWPVPIDPAQVLDAIAQTNLRFIVMDKEQADAMALWDAHTFFFDDVQISPIAIINAPEKECAKTLLQDVNARMVNSPLSAANITISAMFRVVESHRPTLFIDEADTFFKANQDMHGMVNAGYKRGSSVVRTESVGDGFEVRCFSVFCPKSIAGIALEKHLPDATMSRGIVFNLRKKLPHEKVERLRYAEPGMFEELASKLARFALDYSPQVRRARPVLPDALSDRAQDNWEILFAIAECAGPEWVQRATAAALALSAKREAFTNTGNELLADIQEVFQTKQAIRITSANLISALGDIEEAPWATYNRGRPITARQLAKQLSPYGIHSKTIRLGPHDTPKGYELAQFADAFARYLNNPEGHEQLCHDSPEDKRGMVGGVSDSSRQIRNEPETPEAMPALESDDVADKTASRDALWGAVRDLHTQDKSGGRVPVDNHPDEDKY